MLTSTAPRRGTSLVELLVALALFGIIGIATLRALDRQARFHAGVLAILDARGQHAAAHEAVATELRSVATSAGDIGRLTDSSVTFRLPVGSGIACGITGAGVDLVPDTLTAGTGFAAFRTTPQPGDTAWVFDEGVSDTKRDDRWLGQPIVSLARATNACAGSAFLHPLLDAGKRSWRLTLGAALPGSVTIGAAVRLTRMARLALYRSGSEHWLGFAEAQPGSGAWIPIQPVSGPYLPYNSSAPLASGVAFIGVDSSGSPTAGPGIAGVALSTRTRTARTVRSDGITRGRYPDSLHSWTAMRNRP